MPYLPQQGITVANHRKLTTREPEMHHWPAIWLSGYRTAKESAEACFAWLFDEAATRSAGLFSKNAKPP